MKKFTYITGILQQKILYSNQRFYNTKFYI